MTARYLVPPLAVLPLLRQGTAQDLPTPETAIHFIGRFTPVTYVRFAYNHNLVDISASPFPTQPSTETYSTSNLA
jgi:hypothetical protein